jgi:hypothetical protein
MFKTPGVPSILLAVAEVMRHVPKAYQWSVELTDDTSDEVPADFRIYVPDEATRLIVRALYDLGRPAEQTDTTETHKLSKWLTLTILEN